MGATTLEATPQATITPVKVPDTRPFGATVLDLASAGYVEEEFYVSGTANRYRITNPLGTAEVIDGGHPYKSRILVRRPVRASDFNGTVLVEWYNVTTGQDVDFTFATLHKHLLREGYAFVAVSAQQVGVNTLRTWNQARYGSLNITASNDDPATGKPIDPPVAVARGGDVLAWDIYGQTGVALRAGAGLGALKPMRVIAIGESQSASRLTMYYNAVHPLHRVYEAFLTYDRARPMRTDIGTKSISIGTAIDLWPGPPPPDSNDHRWWEIAGSSHVSLQDAVYIDPIIKRDGVLRDPNGKPVSLSEAIPGCQMIPIWSRVPNEHVVNAGLEHLMAWITKGVVPPTVTRLARTAEAKPLRDAEGRVSGGVRLPAYEVPMAANGGYNAGPGFCFLVGYHVDFSEAKLCKLYKNHDGYVKRVAEATRRAQGDGFLLPADAKATIAEAEKVRFSCADK